MTFTFRPTAIVCLLLCSCSGGRDGAQPPLTVRIDTAATYTPYDMLQFPGRVRAAQEVNLAFRVSGTLQHLAAGEGARIRSGELLAALDDRDYRVQAEAAEAEYLRVKAEAERVTALYDDGVATPDAYDKARYGLLQVTAKYENSRNQLADTRIYAPFDGYVQRRLFDPPTVIGAGTPVVTLVSDGQPEIEIHIPGSAYIRRADFDAFTAVFDVWPDRKVPLRLLSISPKANANQLYTMRLGLADDAHPLPAPGMNALVTVAGRIEGETRVVVSATALFTRNGEPGLWLFDPQDSTVRRREVRVESLRSNGDAVLCSGLSDGELVVTSGTHQLTDGAHVVPLPRTAVTNIGGLL